MTDDVSITSRRELEAWLEDKPAEWSRVIAMRAALRVFPLVFEVLNASEDGVETDRNRGLILQSWRAIFISLMALAVRGREVRYAAALAADAAYSASRDFDSAGATAPDLDAVQAVFLVAGGAAEAAAGPDTVVEASVVRAASFAARAVANAAFAAAGAWEAVEADCLALANTPADKTAADLLSAMPLWIDPIAESERYATNAPESTRRAFDRFANRDWVRGRSWALITDWYAAILPNGRDRLPRNIFANERGRKLALEPDDFWTVTDDRSPDEIINDVAEILGWEADQPQQLSNDVELPATVPATLEPEWQEGHLRLPKGSARDDFAGGDIDEALVALKQVLAGFADELSGSNNIDRRIVAYMQRLAIEAPSVVPSQAGFFTFAHNEKVLEAYVTTAEHEWDALSAARMGAVSLQFSQTVDKVPAWRAFKRIAPDGELSADDVDAAEALGEVLADALREGLAVEFVDGEIADSVKELAEGIPEIESPGSDDRLVTRDVEIRAFDLLESVNNTLKRVVGAALWVKGAVGQLGTHTWDRISAGIRAEYGEQCEKLGKHLVKLAFGVLKFGVPGALGGMPLAVWLTQTFPKQFAWLEPVVKLFGIG